MRYGLPVFTIERSCLAEISALRRPPGANRRDDACAMCIGCFSSCFLSGGHPERKQEEKQRGSDIQHNGHCFPHVVPFRHAGEKWVIMFNMDCFIFPPPGEKSHADGNATTMAASKPPPTTAPRYFRLFLFPAVSSHLVDSTLRRVRLTVYALRNSGDIRRSASPSAPRSGVKHPAERQRLKKIVTIS